MRRSALLALLAPLRRGELAHWDRFTGYADELLADREFFIRKAIGWVLRETAKKHPDQVAGWLRPRLHRISGVTVREAVRWLPGDQQAALMAAYRQYRTPIGTMSASARPAGRDPSRPVTRKRGVP